MSSEHCFETAKLHYDIKDYDVAFNICMELLSENAAKFSKSNDKDVLKENYKLGTLAAKSLLFRLSTPDENSSKLFSDAVTLACGFTNNLDELFWLENEILTAFYYWEKQVLENMLSEIANKVDIELYKKYIYIRLQSTKMILIPHTMIRNSTLIVKHCSDNGISVKDYLAEHDQTLPKRISDEELSLMNYEAAKKIYADIKNKLVEYSDVNLEVANTITSALCTEYVLASCLPTCFSCEDYPETQLKCLKLSAEIERDWFEAKIYPNGNPLSVFRGNRANQLETSLKKTYNKIIELDPEFVIPPLPSTEYIDLPKSKQSGGCYVATAVYGSYDCPEVWTLRRFRDNILAKSFFGRLFILIYYTVSPTLVKWFGETEWFKNMWKPILDKKIKKLNFNGVENTPYDLS